MESFDFLFDKENRRAYKKYTLYTKYTQWLEKQKKDFKIITVHFNSYSRFGWFDYNYKCPVVLHAMLSTFECFGDSSFYSAFCHEAN